MVDHIRSAREAIDEAVDVTGDAVIREQLQTIEDGLAVLQREEADERQGDRLEEVESKLVGLGDETDDDVTADRLETARDHIDAYRREFAQDWK